MKDKRQILEKYLIEILRNEIKIADESYFILQAISQNWDNIKIDGFNLFFKSAYSAYFIRFSLALTKLFDKPSKNYETVSIPFVIKFIKENFLTQPIQERPNLNKQFCELGFEYSEVKKLSDSELGKLMILHFENKSPISNPLNNLHLSKTLDVIKLYRDKLYSHNENVDTEKLPKIEFSDALELLLFAKQFLSIFSLAYLNVFQKFNNSEYTFTNNAKRTKTSFERILRKAGFI